MNNAKIEDTKEIFQNIRYAFICLFELLIFIIFLELIIVSSINTSFSTPIKEVSIQHQEIRAVSIFFAYLCLSTSIAFIINVFFNKKKTRKEKILTTISVLPIINIGGIAYYFYLSFKEGQIVNYILHVFSSTNTEKQICYKHAFATIKNKKIRKNDHLFWNTFISTLVFCISIVSFIFIFLSLDKPQDLDDPRNLWWFRKFSYFTEWSNFSCFLVCTLFLLNNRWKIFNNGKFVNYIAIYILFVFLIFWLILLPGSAIINGNFSFENKNISSIISTGWFHLIMPLSYVVFVGHYNYFLNNKKNINIKNYYKTILYFPLTYALYSYTLPFISNITIYGLMTNANPNNIPFGDKYPGEYWHLVFIPILLIVFCGLTWTFLKVIKKMNSKNNIQLQDIR